MARKILSALICGLFGVLVLLALTAPFAPPTHAQCPTCPPRPDPVRPEPVRPDSNPREPLVPNPDRNVPPAPTAVSAPTAAPTVTPETTRVIIIAIPPPAPSASPEAPLPPHSETTPEPPAVVTSPPPPPSPATVLAMPTFPTTIVLNEYRAQAANADNEWIELYNAGDSAVDLSGWRLAHTANGGGVYTIPAGATIAPRGFLVFTRAQTGLTLDLKLDDVQLLYPTGAFADQTRHASLRANQVYARSSDGAGMWLADCKPTPNAANCPAIAGAGNFFRDHIASPARLGDFNVVAFVTNLLLALILALAMGFFGNMLNAVLESNEQQIAGWFAPVCPVLDALRRAADAFDAAFAKRRLVWLGWLIKLGFMLALYGVIFAHLDPSFSIGQVDGWQLIAAMALSAGVIGVIDDLAQYMYLRRRNSRGVIRLHGGNLALAIVSALFSRFSGMTPGLLFGNPAGIEDVDDPSFEIPSHLLALGAMGGAAIVAWLITPLFGEETWLRTALLLIFAMGVQSVFFELLPVKYLHGRGIYDYNRWLWGGLFVFITVVFFQTMLNPDGDFVSAFNQANMVTLSLVVVTFCLISAGLWYYFQRGEKVAAQG